MLRYCRHFLSLHHNQPFSAAAAAAGMATVAGGGAHDDFYTTLSSSSSSSSFESSVVAPLSVLHKSLMGRETAPDIMIEKATEILSSDDAAHFMTQPEAVPFEVLPVFAAQVAAFVRPKSPPTADFLPRLCALFEYHLEAAENAILNAEGGGRVLSSTSSRFFVEGDGDNSSNNSYYNNTSGGMAASSSSSSSHSVTTGRDPSLGSLPRLVASILECIVAFCGPHRVTSNLLPQSELCNCLRQAQSLGQRLLALEARQFVPGNSFDMMMNNNNNNSSSNNSTATSASAVDDDGNGRKFNVSNRSSTKNSNVIRCAPRDIIAFLKGADILIGGPACFTFSKRGVPPLVMLPIKNKHDMLRKSQKFPVLHDLTRALEKKIPLITTIDAIVCIKYFAVVGLFEQPIVDACVERVRSAMVITPHQHKAEVILHLGVLGYRHVAAPDIMLSIDTSELGAAGIRKLLRGMAMLQMPIKSIDVVRRIHDHVWMYALRPSEKNVCDLSWHIDVAHALVALKAPHYLFVLRTCRLIRRQQQQQRKPHSSGEQHHSRLVHRQGIDALSHLQRSQLLWTLGQIVRSKVPADLDKDWKNNVNRVKNALIKECQESVKVEDAEIASLLWQGLGAVGISPASIMQQQQQGSASPPAGGKAPLLNPEAKGPKR